MAEQPVAILHECKKDLVCLSSCSDEVVVAEFGPLDLEAKFSEVRGSWVVECMGFSLFAPRTGIFKVMFLSSTVLPKGVRAADIVMELRSPCQTVWAKTMKTTNMMVRFEVDLQLYSGVNYQLFLGAEPALRLLHPIFWVGELSRNNIGQNEADFFRHKDASIDYSSS